MIKTCKDGQPRSTIPSDRSGDPGVAVPERIDETTGGIGMPERPEETRRKDFVSVARNIQSYLGNPLTRAMMDFYTRRTVHRGSLVRYALRRYSKDDEDFRFIPTLLAFPLTVMIEFGRVALRASRREVEQAFASDYRVKGLANVLRSLAEHGVTRPQILSAPFLVVWNLTNACNLRCLHCYQAAGKPLPDELSLEEKRAVIDELDNEDVVVIAFSGGEPLMARDFFQTASYASAKGMYVSVATNGTLLTPSMVRKLKEAGVKYVEVSVDGATPKTHDVFRGVEGAWQRTVQGIRNCIEAGIDTVFATTVTRYNFDEFDSMVDLAKRLNVSKMVVFNFIPTGRGREIAQADLTPDMREELLTKMYHHMANGFQILSTAPQLARICLAAGVEGPMGLAHFGDAKLSHAIRALAEFVGGCGCGRLYSAIQPNGDVTPCVFIPLVVGNLRRQSFREIWTKSEVFQSLRTREHLRGACGSCAFKMVCGGCRARSYGYFGDFNAPDIGCVYNVDEWDRYLGQQGETRATERAEALVTES